MAGEPNKVPPKQQKNRGNISIYIVSSIILLLIIYYIVTLSQPKSKKLEFQEFDQLFTSDLVTTMNVRPGGPDNLFIYIASGEAQDPTSLSTFRYFIYLTEEQVNDYANRILTEQKSILYNNNPYTRNLFLEYFLSFLPYLIIGGIFLYVFIRTSSKNNSAFEFTKNRARLSRDAVKSFQDVAGCDEEKQELEEIIDFLKNPRKYIKIGARIPKGVLLVGPPGTGKTLLAKAVAGEASVPFYSISGSDFVELFVGVGASRVRDLFKTAKANTPCIIFIDEIDAVGRQRGSGLGGSHDEREQTLNQLLVEMDGFGNNSGIVIIAATNRADVLDPALLRPGRFDRQITINNPDVLGREAILNVHAKNKKIDPSIKFHEIAQRIPGFSGADIENLLNEAALLAARDNRTEIVVTDIDEAIDRVILGPAKRNLKITPNERKMNAYHEAGHAVIGLRLSKANIVQKVTIVPRGLTGGYNLMLPEEEKFSSTKSELIESITGFLGGRASEEIVFNEISTGAHNDIQRATRIARAMVTEYGMSDLGPIQYEKDQSEVFLGRDYLKERNISDTMAHEIDMEVKKIISLCHSKALEVIRANIALLDNIANYLLKIETLTRADIDEIDKTGKLAWYDLEKDAS